MSAAAPPNVCPVCSSRLEQDGVCLVCLLQEGLEADHVTGQPGSTPTPPARHLTLPCDFAGYRLVREIACGGMGVVYEAEDVKLRRVVAMKVIRNAHFATRDEAARFRAETQAVAQLDHPDIVPIYESGEYDGMPYYTMRLAEGGSLAERLKKRGVMPDREAATFLSRIARAVQHAHDHGVLHRDLKPANILLDVAGKPMLSDFGLAKLLDAEFQLTRSNAYVGTPHYMSPEQAAGRSKEVTIASDVWALGVMLYQMVTDKLPFQGGSAVEVMRRITQEEPEISSTGKLISRSSAKSVETKPVAPSMSQISQIQRDLATLILRCLEKQPARRLASAGFLADELDRFLQGKPIQSRSVGSFERLWKLALRNKAATLGILATSAALIGGMVISLWHAVKAERAEQTALQQKAESDEIASIVMATVRSTDEHVVGKDLDSDQMRDELLRRVAAFQGDPGRKAAMLMDLSAMLRKPADIQVFRQVLAELESRLKADDPLLWSLRYLVALKMMHASDAASAESREARDELRRILAWQTAHLDAGDTQTYRTKYALAEELLDEVGTPEALREAEELLRSCVAHYERKRDTFDIITGNIELMSVVFNQGRQEEALKLGRETCELAMKKEGEGHAITGRALGRLAKHCREAGLVEESITHARHALDIYWHTVGPDYVKANATLDALAGTLEKKGDREAALQLRRDSLLVCDQQLGPMSPETQWQAARAVEALQDLHRLEEAHALAELWLERVRVDGRLPPGAAALLMFDFLTLQELGRHGQAEALLQHLPGLLKAQQWGESAYYVLRRWKAVAARLNQAGRPSECLMIVKHLIQALDKDDISGRKATGLRPEFEELLEAAEAAQKAAVAAGKGA
ncbi:serine/threonine-protein kinase [Prosthecobacter sp.]|uniref:serine/threonine-protein kinase n=1 Tax=Prosthecobacter sp. TaxID=1965333 RepID=UPI002ABA6586|nr:serine/threonine-protein kinase [Prosthecobacter sp.]MDZ4401971.1 serine/threonine-protein kinase [Prosthecobacter sp.]